MAANNEVVKRGVASILHSPSCRERLSGKYLNGSGCAFLGSAERRKLRHFVPSCGLLGPRYGARSEFPDSLEKGYSRKLVVASPATNILFYSAQSSVTPLSCWLPPGY